MINNLLTPITNIDELEQHLFITNPSYSNIKYKKLDVYNQNIKSFGQKIWIKTPKLKTTESIKYNLNKFSLKLKLGLGPLVDEIKYLYDFITKIEQIVQNHFRENFKQHTFVSSIIDNKKYYPVWKINLPIIKQNEKLFQLGLNVYNHDNHKIQLGNLSSGTEVALYVELKEIWMSDDSFGCVWSGLQMKLYPKLDFARCLFDDLCDTNIKPEEETNCYHCLKCPNHYHVVSSTVINNNPPIHLPKPLTNPLTNSIKNPLITPPLFNPADLLNMKQKLKSIDSKPTGNINKTEINTRSSFLPSLDDILNAKNKLKSLKQLPAIETNIKESNKIIDGTKIIIRHKHQLRIDRKKNKKIMKRYYKLLNTNSPVLS
jgi:hypothetical protein